MKMNKLTGILLITILMLSCKKNEEQLKNTLCRKWQTDKEFINGQSVQFSAIFKYFEFKKNGDYIEVVDVPNNTDQEIIGTWKFYDKQQFIINNIPSYSYRGRIYPENTDTIEILRLKKNQLWVGKEINNSKIEVQYKLYE